jgi:serine/threonine protein phosphatase PrpC
MKVNQDSFLLAPSFHKKMHLFGIADGHGQYGQEVSEYIKNQLPKVIVE